GQCEDARDTFKSLDETALADPDLQANLAARAIEVDICLLEQTLERGERDAAIDAVQSARQNLDASSVPDGDREAAETRLEAVCSQIVDSVSSDALASANAEDCVGAGTQLDSLTPIATEEELAPHRAAVAD